MVLEGQLEVRTDKYIQLSHTVKENTSVYQCEVFSSPLDGANYAG